MTSSNGLLVVAWFGLVGVLGLMAYGDHAGVALVLTALSGYALGRD